MTWQILTGDCIEQMRDLPDDSIDAIVTDPPYGQTSLDWDKASVAWIEELDRILKPSGSAWVFGSLKSLVPVVMAFAEMGWNLAQDCIWEKHNGSSFHADRFRRVHEQVAHFYRGKWGGVYVDVQTFGDDRKRTERRKARPPHMGAIGNGGTYESEDVGKRLTRSVIHVRSMHGRAIHPTQKPTGILEPLIRYSTPAGGTVLDPFAGSGSTVLAAKECGRSAIGIERDPEMAIAAQGFIESSASLFGGGVA